MFTTEELTIMRNALDYALEQYANSNGEIDPCCFGADDVDAVKNKMGILLGRIDFIKDKGPQKFMDDVRAEDMVGEDFAKCLQNVLDTMCAYLLVNFEVLDDADKKRVQIATLCFATMSFSDPEAALKSCPNYVEYLFK